MKLKRKHIITAAVIVLTGALAAWLITRTPFEQQRPAVGEKAPEVHLADVTGRMINLDDHLGGVVLINFWADWCPPCKDELGWFQSVYADYRDRGLEIVAVSIDDLSVEQAMGLDVSYRVAVANERVMEAYGGVSGVPVSFLVGSDGRIIRKHRRAWPEEDIRKSLDEVLKGN